MEALQVGLRNETSHVVGSQHLASNWGSGLAQVLATPVLVAFCEECCRLTVDPLLPEGQQTVGSEINLKHLAATPPGMRVRIAAELIEVDGRRLRFRVQAWDDAEQICAAEHERFVIDVGRFRQRLETKQSRALARFLPVPRVSTNPPAADAAIQPAGRLGRLWRNQVASVDQHRPAHQFAQLRQVQIVVNIV